MGGFSFELLRFERAFSGGLGWAVASGVCILCIDEHGNRHCMSHGNALLGSGLKRTQPNEFWQLVQTSRSNILAATYLCFLPAN